MSLYRIIEKYDLLRVDYLSAVFTGMRKSMIRFWELLIIVILFYTAGCRYAGKWLTPRDVPNDADAMILLMGSFPERVLQAVKLYHAGVVDKLIIVYENMGPYQVLEARGASVIRTTEQARDAAVALGIPDSCITMLPGDARSTLDEALAVKEYIAENPGLDTLLLVSSPTHMRRAYMIFSAVMKDAGTNIYIGTSPSVYSSFDSAKWWRRREDVQAVLYEWVKIVGFVIFERGKIE